MTEFSQEEQEYIIEMFDDGRPIYEIGDYYGVTQNEVLEKLDEWGAFDKHRKPQARDYKDEIINLYNEGHTCEEIAATYGFSKSTIWRNLTEWGAEFTRGYNFDDHAKEEIIELYLSGKSYEYIADEFGCSAATISDRLGEWEIVKRGTYKIEYSDEDKADIMQLYQEGGLNTYQIAELFEGNAATIRKRLNRWGVETSRFTYQTNDNYFSNVTHPDNGYWVGFIGSDGNVNEHTVKIGLHERDKNHLQKFLDCTESTYPIYHYGIKVEVHIRSKQMVQDLYKCNITPNKSLTLEPWYEVPLIIERDYWRGNVDGDGTLGYMRSKGKEYPYISLCGTWEICNGFKQFCDKYSTSNASINKNSSIFSYKVVGLQAIPIIRALYQNATVYLDRKYEIAMQILAQYPD